MSESDDLETKRRARLFALIRAEDSAGDAANAPLDEDGFPPGFLQRFQDRAARSLGQRAADRRLAQSLRGRR